MMTQQEYEDAMRWLDDPEIEEAIDLLIDKGMNSDEVKNLIDVVEIIENGAD